MAKVKSRGACPAVEAGIRATSRPNNSMQRTALLVAVLDLVPLVGTTLGGAVLVIVGLFVEPWKALVLLVFVLIYQQVESNFLQPMVYSKAVQLNGLVILIALMVGAQLLGIPGALLAMFQPPLAPRRRRPKACCRGAAGSRGFQQYRGGRGC